MLSSRRRLGPVLRDLSAEESRTAFELVEAVDAVFDADPAVEADAGQLGEDRVVVVHALADLAVAQPLGVADAVFLAAQVFDRALGQVAVAGVHRDDAVLHAPQQLQRVFAGEDRVAGVVVDAEVRASGSRSTRSQKTSILWANSGCCQ